MPTPPASGPPEQEVALPLLLEDVCSRVPWWTGDAQKVSVCHAGCRQGCGTAPERAGSLCIWQVDLAWGRLSV